MRKIMCFGAVMVLLGTFTAFAQEPSLKDAQKQSFPAQPGEPAQHTGPDGTTPPPPLTQPQSPIADQAAPASVGPAQNNTADSTTTEPAANAAPLGATAQTTPSTISKGNAARDALPITALQFPLTEEQKQLIVKSVAAVPKTPDNPNLVSVHVAMFLPIGVPMQTFSGELTQQVPDAARYKYVKLNDRILIVDPPALSVVGEIKL